MMNRMITATQSSLRRFPRCLPAFNVPSVGFVSPVGLKHFEKKDPSLTYSVFDGSHVGLVKSILKNDFTANREPVCYHLSARNFDFLVDPYLVRAMSDGNTVIVSVNEVVAGVALNHDLTVKPDQNFLNELKKRDYFGFDLLFEIERDLNRDFCHQMHDKELWHEGNILSMTMVAVDPYFAHQGLGTLLTEKVIEKAKEKGFKYVTCAATNSFMQHSCQKLGFECVNTMQYETWEYPKGSGIHPKAGMPEITGFNEMNLMVFRIPQKKK